MRLKELRQSRKLLQRDVADALNCSTPVYCRYEKGEREPPFDTLKKLAEFYGVTIDYLMGGDATKDQPAPVPAQEKAPADMRAEAKRLLEAMDDDTYQAALQYLKFLNAQEGK